MKAPLEQRASDALRNPAIKLADLQALRSEADTLETELRAKLDTATADSVDWQLSEPDRDAAVRLAEASRRRLTVLAGAASALDDAIAERKASENAQKISAARKEAVDQRDALSERWKDAEVAIIAPLLSLLAETQENARALKKAGLAREPDAELMGRGMLTGHVNGSPVMLYSQMRVPDFRTTKFCWPTKSENPGGVHDYDKALKRAEDRVAKARATFGMYRLEPSGERVQFTSKEKAPLCVKQRQVSPATGPMEGIVLLHDEAKRLEGLGVKTEAMEWPGFEHELMFYTA